MLRLNFIKFGEGLPSKTLAAHILGYSNRDFDQKSSSGFERWLYKNQIKNDQINLTINLNAQNHLENILKCNRRV